MTRAQAGEAWARRPATRRQAELRASSAADRPRQPRRQPTRQDAAAADRLRQPPVGRMPGVVRGGSWGFTMLLVGELVILHLLGLNIGVVLYVIAALAFALAGNRAVTVPVISVRVAARDGAAAAVLAYGLTVPLRLIAHDALSLLAVAVTVAFAVIVGGLAGAIVGRARLQTP